MSLPSQLLAGPGREQEPETCNNPVKIPGRIPGTTRLDVCGFDLAPCDRCGRVACPECEDWPADGDDMTCRECRCITNEQRAAKSDQSEKLTQALAVVKKLRSQHLPGPVHWDLAALENLLKEVKTA